MHTIYYCTFTYAVYKACYRKHVRVCSEVNAPFQASHPLSLSLPLRGNSTPCTTTPANPIVSFTSASRRPWYGIGFLSRCPLLSSSAIFFSLFFVSFVTFCFLLYFLFARFSFRQLIKITWICLLLLLFIHSLIGTSILLHLLSIVNSFIVSNLLC